MSVPTVAPPPSKEDEAAKSLALSIGLYVVQVIAGVAVIAVIVAITCVCIRRRRRKKEEKKKALTASENGNNQQQNVSRQRSTQPKSDNRSSPWVVKDLADYDKQGHKRVTLSKGTTTSPDTAGYDHMADTGDTVTIINTNGQVVKQRAAKCTTTSMESPGDLALSEDSPYSLAEDEGLHENDEDDTFAIAFGEGANDEYQSAYSLARSENNNGDDYYENADVKPVRHLNTLTKATEEDSEIYVNIPHITDDAYDTPADVKTTESPYALAYFGSTRGKEPPSGIFSTSSGH